ncbi:PEP-CTERM sorting domain-containing protein [Massilia aerilata]|uniref:PEP-CTERM sorting domain-containing protein n=1 Tax=Massilia aerilata TaxID=453817 RepID=A0ABW0S6B9_9BURK
MRLKLAVALASLLVSMTGHATLLTNGGAETGNLLGWTVGGVSNPRVDGGSFDPGINPRTGGYMFSGYSGAWGTLTQNVLLPGFGQMRQVAVSFWEQGLDQDIPSDDAYVSLTYRTHSGSVISSVSTATVDSHDGVWTQYQGIFDVPLLAWSVDYTMYFHRNFGLDLDSFIDDNSLTLVGGGLPIEAGDANQSADVPEPASAALVLLGLGSLALLRRRRG